MYNYRKPELGLKRNITTSEKIILRDEHRLIKMNNLDFSNAPDMLLRRQKILPR